MKKLYSVWLLPWKYGSYNCNPNAALVGLFNNEDTAIKFIEEKETYYPGTKHEIVHIQTDLFGD